MKHTGLLEAFKKYIGMRNIKTALAVVISVFIANTFHLESPFFVATGALISMETTVRKGIKVGVYRVLGTVIGGCIGVIMFLIDPGNLILLFIGIVILISLLNLLNWHDCISMACVVFCVIMITMTTEDIVHYAFQRTFDTIVGIVISIIINYLISPPQDSIFSKETEDKEGEEVIEKSPEN